MNKSTILTCASVAISVTSFGAVQTILVDSDFNGSFDAVTYTETVSLPSQSLVTINLPRYDASAFPLGNNPNLINVDAFVEVSFANITVELDNDAASANTGTAQLISAVQSFTNSGEQVLDFLDGLQLQPSGNQAFNLDADDGDNFGTFDVGTPGTDYDIWQPGAITGSDTASSFSSPTLYNPFDVAVSGPGTVSTSIQSNYGTTANFQGENGFFQGNTPNATYTFSVTYFTDGVVPEPSAFAGLFGLAGLLIARRRA